MMAFVLDASGQKLLWNGHVVGVVEIRPKLSTLFIMYIYSML